MRADFYILSDHANHFPVMTKDKSFHVIVLIIFKRFKKALSESTNCKMIHPKEPKNMKTGTLWFKVIVFILKEIIFIFYNHWPLTQGSESDNMATALRAMTSE